MLFPRTIFADKNDIAAQLNHLNSEMHEVVKAWGESEGTPPGSEEYNRLCDELVDIQHSADTALMILQEKYGADAYGAYGRVTRNNAKRGYYGEANGRTSSE